MAEMTNHGVNGASPYEDDIRTAARCPLPWQAKLQACRGGRAVKNRYFMLLGPFLPRQSLLGLERPFAYAPKAY